MSENVQGPSVFKVPARLPDPQGKYYFYFADHKGMSLGLAYADAITGPWRIHQAASLKFVLCIG